jgi:hypothetical protein
MAPDVALFLGSVGLNANPKYPSLKLQWLARRVASVEMSSTVVGLFSPVAFIRVVSQAIRVMPY